MESESSIIQPLQEYAKKTNRSFKHNHTPYDNSNYRMQNAAVDTVVIVEKNISEPKFISFYNSKEYNYYSGFFLSIDLPKETMVLLASKNVFHKLNPFHKHSNRVSGYRYFDSVGIISNNSNYKDAVSLLSNAKLSKLIIKALSIDPRVKVGVNYIIPENEFENKSVLGIFIQKAWFSNTNLIDKLFKVSEEIREVLS